MVLQRKYPFGISFLWSYQNSNNTQIKSLLLSGKHSFLHEKGSNHFLSFEIGKGPVSWAYYFIFLIWMMAQPNEMSLWVSKSHNSAAQMTFAAAHLTLYLSLSGIFHYTFYNMDQGFVKWDEFTSCQVTQLCCQVKWVGPSLEISIFSSWLDSISFLSRVNIAKLTAESANYAWNSINGSHPIVRWNHYMLMKIEERFEKLNLKL